jgi:hypothetical protein
MNQLHISAISPATQEVWLDTARNCAYATFFHTPDWADLMTRYSTIPSSSAPLLFEFSDGATAVLPRIKRSRFSGLFTTYESCAAGTYGGWISASALTSDHAALLATWIRTQWFLVLRENPYDPLFHTIDLPYSTSDTTQTVDLLHSPEELYNNASPAHHKALKKGMREGVTVRKAQSIDDWTKYYSLYERSLARWKEKGPAFHTRYIYPWALFAKCKELPACSLWCAEQNGKIVSGIVCFYWNSHAVAWHGAADETAFGSRPNNLLYWTALLAAKESGYHWFDCNPSGGYEGVTKFKELLGAQQRQSRVVSIRPWWVSLAQKIRGR